MRDANGDYIKLYRRTDINTIDLDQNKIVIGTDEAGRGPAAGGAGGTVPAL